jgi:hypothetical protein
MVEQNGVERRMELLCHGGPTSCLSIGLSSFDHLSIRYIDALFLRTPMKLSFPSCWRKRDCFAGDSRNNIALLWFGELPDGSATLNMLLRLVPPPLLCTSLPLNCIPHAAWVNGTFLQLVWRTECRDWVTEPRASCPISDIHNMERSSERDNASFSLVSTDTYRDRTSKQVIVAPIT